MFSPEWVRFPWWFPHVFFQNLELWDSPGRRTRHISHDTCTDNLKNMNYEMSKKNHQKINAFVAHQAQAKSFSADNKNILPILMTEFQFLCTNRITYM